MKEALEILIGLARNHMKIDDTLTKLGYVCNPSFDVYGDIIDAICYLLNDRQESVELTKAYQVLSMESATIEQQVDLLMGVEACAK